MKKDIPVLFLKTREAESIKLFSNAYLALRVAFFNELDTYAEMNQLDSKSIIEGVSLDPRIGNFYNNPSFGYGGYCLPKDTKQLLANYKSVPQKLITAIVTSNETRKKHIAKMIIKKKPKVIGIYRLVTKRNSDNFRYSSIQDVIKYLKEKNTKIIIYEPDLDESVFDGNEVIKDFSLFSEHSDIIVANRLDKQLQTVQEKVYSRDLFVEND